MEIYVEIYEQIYESVDHNLWIDFVDTEKWQNGDTRPLINDTAYVLLSP